MVENKRIGFFAPIPVRIFEDCGVKPVFVPLLLEKYLDQYGGLIREGEELGFDLNSPLISRIAVPLVKRESIEKVVIVSPLDIREVLTAFEVWGKTDFFLFRVMEPLDDELVRLGRFLGCNQRVLQSVVKEEYVVSEDELHYALKLIAPWVSPSLPDSYGPPIGLLGEFPPAMSFIIELVRLFRVKFVEFLHLILDSFFWRQPGMLLSPVDRARWLNEICEDRKLGGFIFLYYSLSSWQNYEIIYSRKLRCPVLALELKEGTGFQERERLRLEAFRNTLKGG